VASTLRMLAISIVALPLIFGQSHKNDLAKYRADFAKETNPVHRGKIMVRLGRAEFEAIETEAAQDDLQQALAGAREYEDQADSVGKALDATGANPERHSAGFKELQISVREALRRLNDLIVGMSGSDQTPFLAIRDKLDALNRHLISELFPSQPGAGLDSGKKKD
jgi:hypothetical protein